MRTASRQLERGDYQTPPILAQEVVRFVVRRWRSRPAAVVDPTCGVGNLLAAATARLTPRRVVGLELDAGHVTDCRRALPGATVRHADFFHTDWDALVATLPEPILVLGNPPWVTNSTLGAHKAGNLPPKSNFQGLKGLEALTGRSNFDISEWMLIRLLEALQGRTARLAMICKAAVARRVLAHAWRTGLRVGRPSFHAIDARVHFGAAVQAGLLVCSPRTSGPPDCRSFDSLQARRSTRAFGWRESRLVSDVETWDRVRHLETDTPTRRWRSGVKHDCARVMELRPAEDGRLRNGLGEDVLLEEQLLFPLLKGSEVARGESPARRMLVTQRSVGEDTADIARQTPLTWRYLQQHAQRLDRRASSIYRGRPRFSVFGVGDYTFKPWKVAISSLHKRLTFRIIGPHRGKPVVFDDTVSFLACDSEAEAREVLGRVTSPDAQEFLQAIIFWDAKRPITISALGRLDLDALRLPEPS